MREKITACIIAFNEEDKLRRCLESLAWCDEIVVVDSFSTDRTVAIAQEFTGKVFQKEWAGFAAQKEYAWEQASNDWILWMDADEALSPELQRELQTVMASEPPQSGFEIPRLVWFLGRWIKHGDWYPDLNIRLFRRSAAKMIHCDVHERVEVDGKTGSLRAPIHHWPFDSVSDLLLKADKYSSLAANGDFKNVRLVDLLFRPGFSFFRGYILKRGFLDGFPGLIVALMNSASVGFKYAKRYESRRG